MKYLIFAVSLLMTGCWCREYVVNPPEPVTVDTTIVTPSTTLEDIFLVQEDGIYGGWSPITLAVRETVTVAGPARIVHVLADCPPETIAVYQTVEATPKVVEKEVKAIPLWGWIAIAGSVIVALAAIIAIILRRVI